MAAGLAYDRRCLLYDNGSMILDEEAANWIDVAHVENAGRIERAYRVLRASGVDDQLVAIPSREVTLEELALVHSERHITRIEKACRADSVQWVGPEARAGKTSWEPALLAAGSALACVDYATSNPGGRSYCLARPPGHHASGDQAMGFCLFNNIALATRHAQRSHGLNRVAIIDWDVHHGNGTQAVFYDDPDVLFISIHQEELYPAKKGRVSERGVGDGLGTTLNIPLPAGSGDDAYQAAVHEVAVPAMADFAPDLLLISSGQDAAASDPLGRMSVTTEGFRDMTRQVGEFAESACDGRVVAIQEGGYSVDHMPFCVLATVEALAGLEPVLAGDPMELDVPKGITDREREAIRESRKAWLSGPK